MEAKATAKMVRISPIKARLVVDLIRGKDASEAQIILNNYNNKASRLIKKVLDSAIANAVNNNKMDEKTLYVSEARVDMGPVMKEAKQLFGASADGKTINEVVKELLG